jgi:hypothetical protein
LLQPFAKCTELLGGQNYVTISDTTFHYEGLSRILNSMFQSCSRPREKAAIQAGLDKLYKYYDKQCVIASLSCVLDPTKNLRFLKVLQWEEEWINTVKDQLRQCYDAYKPSSGAQTVHSNVLYAELLGVLQGTSEDEIERYYAYPSLPQGTDILAWWKSTGRISFPTLAKVAKDYFALPASSVASERVFSQAADICTSDRNRLDPETVSDAMCLKMWLQRQQLINIYK